MANKGVPIGLSNVVIALLQDDPDPDSGLQATYSAPQRILGAISAMINPNAANAILFADDGPYDVASTIGEITMELNVADIPLPMQAIIFGHTYSGGVLIRKAEDVPPWVAVGFKSLKSNGSYRYTWLAKGKFALSEQNNQTKGDSIEYNTPTVTASFVKRDSDNEWERHIDEDDVDFIPAMATNWFTNPFGGAPDTTPPTLTSHTPAADATGVPVNSSITLTFSEAMALSSLTYENIVVFDGSGDPVDGTLSVNGSRTVVTFAPSAALEASSQHIVTISRGVRDAYGNEMAAARQFRFTTA